MGWSTCQINLDEVKLGMIEEPFFTIIIPVYNVENYLDRCVESIISAIDMLHDVAAEVILVDDGSTDSSPNICDKWASQRNDVVAIHKKNGGLASARNAGLDVAKGKYILFCDSDDWIERETLIELYKVQSVEAADIVKYGYRRIEDKQNYSEYPCIDEGRYVGENVEAQYPVALGNGDLFNYNKVYLLSVCMALYKKELIDKYAVRFISEREILNEDILFNLEYIARIKTLYVLHKCFYNYECRGGSLTQRYKPQMYERKCALIDYINDFIAENGLSNDLLNERYAQFVIQHLYDCLVMEVQWNKDKKSRNESIRRILEDERLRLSIKQGKNLQKGFKAKIILGVMATKNPFLFYWLYKLGKR